MPFNPKLRFDESEIHPLSGRYKYARDDADLIAMRPTVLKRGFLLKDELFRVALWKAPRNKNRVVRNPDGDISEITHFALHAKSERARIESLLMLYGVGWPLASVLLHFFHEERYPILDFRALWSTQIRRPSYYGFELWSAYVAYCRNLADKNHVDMRTLDKALWQYSFENQRA